MTMVFHQGALGDWVLLLPLLRTLMAGGRQITVITAGSKGQLACDLFPGLHAIDIERRDFTVLHSEGGHERVSPEWRRACAEVDLLISLVSNGQDAWAANAQRLWPRAHRCFVPPRPPVEWPAHVCKWHRRELARQGVLLPGESPAVPARCDPSGPVVLHAGSGGSAKCWPVDRFEAVIRVLLDRGFAVRVLLGEVEQQRWPAAQFDRWVGQYRAGVLTSLTDLREALSGARLYVGNDAGPTHLAAQLGLPTVALFGPTSPVQWAPRGPTVTVVAPPTPQPMTWLDIDTVLLACGVSGHQA